MQDQPDHRNSRKGNSGSVALVGYSDHLSGRPGDTLEFKVSSAGTEPFTAWLTRSISADPNPAGAGVVEHSADAFFASQSFPSRVQPFHPGSFALTEETLNLSLSEGFVFAATVLPTLAKSSRQTILSVGELALYLDEQGAATMRIGGAWVSTPGKLELHAWHRLEGCYDPLNRCLKLSQTKIGRRGESPAVEALVTLDAVGDTASDTQDDALGDAAGHAAGDASSDAISGAAAGSSSDALGRASAGMGSGRVCLAACWRDDAAVYHFNGKIESPIIYRGTQALPRNIAAAWDLATASSSTTVHDTGPSSLHARLVNFPARGMKSSRWDASEMCWRHAPEHYAAIHFHDDDIYDFQWQTDFTFTIPEAMPSGVYVMRIRCGEDADAMPFFVCAPKGDAGTEPGVRKPGSPSRSARVCVLIPTFTYAVYGNHARPDFEPSWQRRAESWNAYPNNPAEHREYGLSTYNEHSDGSGICHASHRRPLFNLRPGYQTFGNTSCSGLRHFQADSHLISWLHAKHIEYDVMTDHELHAEGLSALEPYGTLLTSSHPEYHTAETLDAIEQFRDSGGHLLYLGGNGFYWRIARHEEADHMIEIRRAEAGIRAWAAEPGEYYNAFDGTYGGLWRRSGRAPQALVGIGFSAQGQFTGSHYIRQCRDPAYDWVFAGVDNEVLGDYGFSGNGAAGYELDRVDQSLGTPENVVVLATSTDHDDDFIVVFEEELTHITNLTGEPHQKLIRADMIYFDVPGGGSVFATGSITFCGSLPWNDFDNDISRILENVIGRHL